MVSWPHPTTPIVFLAKGGGFFRALRTIEEPPLDPLVRLSFIERLSFEGQKCINSEYYLGPRKVSIERDRVSYIR